MNTPQPQRYPELCLELVFGNARSRRRVCGKLCEQNLALRASALSLTSTTPLSPIPESRLRLLLPAALEWIPITGIDQRLG